MEDGEGQNPATGNSLNTEGSAAANSQPAANATLESAMASMVESNEPGAEPTNNGEKAKGSENTTQTDNAEKPAWTSQLQKEVSDNADLMKRLNKFTNISDLAKSYAELEGKIGNSIVKPGKDATEAELNDFYEKLGRPKDANGYSVNDEKSQFLREIAFANGITDKQFSGLVDGLNKFGEQFTQNVKAQQAQMLKATDEAMHKEYGNKYSEKVAFMQQGIRAYGGKELGQVLSNAGLLYHPAIVKLFISLGEQNAEASTVNRGASGTPNYKSNAEGGIFETGYRKLKGE